MMQPGSKTHSPRIHIQPLTRQDHLDAAVSLQREIWGCADIDVDPRTMLVIASRFVGEVLGAFDGERLIGMTLSFYTEEPGRMHSHRVGVLSGYQNQGVGLQLKLAQRRSALARGCKIMQWTFDAFQSRNAYFNLQRLGGSARTYITDFYGTGTTSMLHAGHPTDRLMIEWHLDSPRVTSILNGELPVPGRESLHIPLPTRERRTDPAEHARVRSEFQEAFALNFVATGFSVGLEQDYYTLERS